jgi:hypothetical protein
MSWNGGFIRAAYQLVKTIGGVDYSNGRYAHGRTATMTVRCCTTRITKLMKRPQRLHARVKRLPAFQQFSADGCVRYALLAKQGPRYGNSLFRIVRRFADPPLMLSVASITRDNVPGAAMESPDPFRVPAQDIRMGQHLGLFAYGIA